MKKLILSAFILLTANAYSANELSCKLEEVGNPSNFSVTTQSVESLLTDELFEAYNAGINIGEENYSYIGELYRDDDSTHVFVVTLQENNHIQDEVGQMSWTIPTADLNKPGVLFVEPITNGYPENKHIMTLTCEIL